MHRDIVLKVCLCNCRVVFVNNFAFGPLVDHQVILLLFYGCMRWYCRSVHLYRLRSAANMWSKQLRNGNVFRLFCN